MQELIGVSVTELAQAIREKSVSAQELVTAHLARLAAINPRLNAVTQLAPDAQERARAADAALARGESWGPLHGVPFTVKDVLGVAGLASPIDWKIRHHAAPGTDSTVVARLRAAGAILLAKSNCPPNGSGSDTENAVTGRTLNPYRLECTPGGSSGGEAVLVAAGGSPLGVGSDGNGGLRVPAHYCGVVTLKPTQGRIPNSGVYNQPGGLTDPRTQNGLLARRVADLALVMPLLIGPDAQDAAVIPMPWRDPAAVQLDKVRVAFFAADPAAPVTREVGNAVGAAAQALARAGVQVNGDRPADLISASRQLNDFWQDLAGSPGRTVIEFYALWDYYRSRLLQFMQNYDALLCPVSHQPAPPFRERDPRRFDYTAPFSLTGYPCAVVRTATAPNGLPIGVQIVGHPWREDLVLALARQLEQEFGGWQRSLE